MKKRAGEAGVNKNKHFCFQGFFSTVFYFFSLDFPIKKSAKATGIPSFCMSSAMLRVVFSGCFSSFLFGSARFWIGGGTES